MKRRYGYHGLMNKEISKSTHPMNARFTLAGSKSISNRALLLASMSHGVSELKGLSTGHDTQIFIQALQQLGVNIASTAHSVIIQGNKGVFNSPVFVNCHSAGTAARFLLACTAAAGGHYYFDGSPQLLARPIAPLLDALKFQGCKFSFAGKENFLPLQLESTGLPGGHIKINGAQSGQFISGLLMAAPLAKSGVTIEQQQVVSIPYIEMTLRMMEIFGIRVEQPQRDHYTIIPQHYQAQNFQVEPDLSSASYFFAAAAVTAGEFTLENFVFSECLQGDKQFLNVLQQMGCEIRYHSSSVTVKGPQKLQGIEINMRDFSDTFMTLAAISPFASSPTVITGIQHTRLQESNRVSVMCNELKKLQVKVDEYSDGMTIYPSAVTSGTIDSHHDHRIAMAFSLIGLKIAGLRIQHAECVQKTCPEFFDLWEKLVH